MCKNLNTLHNLMSSILCGTASAQKANKSFLSSDIADLTNARYVAWWFFYEKNWLN